MNRKPRLDLYYECNVDGASVDDFTAQCCMHCINPECSRSSFGQSKFDLRVNTWEERLFTQVPRMDEADPRYANISGQRFLAINPPLGSIRSDWMDPRDLEKSQPAPTAAKTPVSPETTPEEEAPEAPTTATTEEPTAQPTTPTKDLPRKPSKGPQLSPELARTNTRVQQGQMIPKKNQEPEAPKSDWSSPLPTTDTEGVRIINPGDKIKIG